MKGQTDVKSKIMQRRLDPGKETPEGFFQVRGISKCGNNIFCTSWKSKHFLFYVQDCGAKIDPATPSWKLNFKWL